MPSDFIKSDAYGNIVSHFELKRPSDIGSLSLIGTYSAHGIRANTTLCRKKESPYYFDTASNVLRVTARDSSPSRLQIGDDGLVTYTNGTTSDKYLPFVVDSDCSELDVLKKNKGNFYCCLNTPAVINGNHVDKGFVKVEFKKFDRSSSWDENLATHYAFCRTARDETDRMIEIFDKLYADSASRRQV